MLHRLQLKYAEQPVRFLLFPCNQFGGQEPKSNADIKAFAEQSVHLGLESNVLMFAKSNLNGVQCLSDTCSLTSSTCCSKNDGVYDYLLAQTKASISWNFDKIFVDCDGHVLPNEEILHGDAVDEKVEAVLQSMAVTMATSTRLIASPIWPGIGGLGLAGAGATFIMWYMVGRSQQQEDAQETYLMLS